MKKVAAYKSTNPDDTCGYVLREPGGMPIICESLDDAHIAAKKINSWLQEAYEQGRNDEASEPWQESPFDEERGEE